MKYEKERVAYTGKVKQTQDIKTIMNELMVSGSTEEDAREEAFRIFIEQ